MSALSRRAWQVMGASMLSAKRRSTVSFIVFTCSAGDVPIDNEGVVTVTPVGGVITGCTTPPMDSKLRDHCALSVRNSAH